MHQKSEYKSLNELQLPESLLFKAVIDLKTKISPEGPEKYDNIIRTSTFNHCHSQDHTCRTI